MQSQTRAGAGPAVRLLWRPAASICGLLGVALSACGSSDTAANEPNSARLVPTIALSGTLTLSSPFALVARFSDDISTAATAGATCAAAAKGFLQDGVRYEPPHNPQGSTFDTLDGQHHTVTITLHINGYNGPTTYGKPNIAGDDGPQLMKVDGYSYGTSLGGDINARVAPDDSGQLSFSGLALMPPTPAAATPTPTAKPTPTIKPTPTAKPTPAPAVKPLSGTLTWTCAQIRASTPTPAPTRPPGAAPAAPTPTPKH